MRLLLEQRMFMANMITIEVVYGLLHEQSLLKFEVEEGVAIKEAIMQSGMLEKYPEIDIETVKVGIFGKMKKMAEVLREKDRIEIYRPLIADPKEVRKKRAAEGKKLKKGGSAPSASTNTKSVEEK